MKVNKIQLLKYNPAVDHESVNSIREKIKRGNIIFSPTDKRNTIIAIIREMKNDYQMKLNKSHNAQVLSP